VVNDEILGLWINTMALRSIALTYCATRGDLDGDDREQA
jgi:hypothetical protein